MKKISHSINPYFNSSSNYPNPPTMQTHCHICNSKIKEVNNNVFTCPYYYNHFYLNKNENFMLQFTIKKSEHIITFAENISITDHFILKFNANNKEDYPFTDNKQILNFIDNLIFE